MKHYYITDNTQAKGFIELSENEFISLFGNKETHPYVSKVYREELAISEIPFELQETVQTIVNNKIARFGEYKNKSSEATIEDYQDALGEFGVEI